jgi:predicted Zn finger-like uncharacterized protein
MSLATRCTSCSTLFRVVQDQLRVSEGWVRCGRCDTVFNALESLVDLEAQAADAGAPAATSPDEADWDRTPPGADPREMATDPRAPEAEAPWEPAPRAPIPASAAPVAAPDEEDPPTVPTPPLPAPSPLAATALQRPSAPIEPVLAPAAAAAVMSAWSAESSAGPPVAGPTPGFVRQAERDARWSSPAMRAALVGCSLMLIALLAGQAAFHFRDELAARSATADGLLRSVCARWGCRVESPRRLSQVTLEGHALSRLPQQPRSVKLALQLRNRGGTALALPSIDLSLTDGQGQLIARRALSPSDFRVDPPVIARGAELPLEVVLSAGEQTIVGYTIELFYP